MRTAAVSALATDLLAPKDARVLALLGSGVQAHSHLEALRLVRCFDEVRVWSRTPANAERFARETGARATSAEESVRGADVIVTATYSSTPVLRSEWLKERCHINAIGAVGPTRRELDDRAIAGYLVVDSREAAMQESGDLLLSGATPHAELGELLAGGRPIREARRTVFKSVGLAVEDVAAAKLVYETALSAR
jgi:thiomorpholine-carboxylate dehydrogenase